MVARVTLLEIDTVRMDLAEAIERFRELVLPGLHEQPGYEGALVLSNPDGTAMVVSLWTDEAAAAAAVEGGFYSEQIQKFVTVFNSPPGRETYDVVFAETPAGTFA